MGATRSVTVVVVAGGNIGAASSVTTRSVATSVIIVVNTVVVGVVADIICFGGVNDAMNVRDDARWDIPQAREMQIIVHTYCVY